MKQASYLSFQILPGVHQLSVLVKLWAAYFKIVSRH
jgi:hypothetical protein